MRLVKTEELKDGQKAAKDVADFRGSLLCKAGTPITTPLIERLKARMVPHVYIEEENAQGAGLSEDDLKKKEAQIDQDLAHLFSEHNDNQLMMALCESARKYLKAHPASYKGPANG